MYTRIGFLTLCLIIFSFCHSQDIKKEATAAQTKMEAFASKTGTITKMTDYNLQTIRLSFAGLAETRIRKISTGGEYRYFFQVESPGKYGSNTASIEYSDLKEVIKALKSLKDEAQKDASDNSNYLENKFISTDGFQVGYFVSKGKLSWFMKLEKYGNDNTIFIKDENDILPAFTAGQNKIEELMK